MNELSRCSTWSIRCGSVLGAAGIAFALCACAHESGDDVKPTDTTAYHSAQPAAQQPGMPAAPAQPRE